MSDHVDVKRSAQMFTCRDRYKDRSLIRSFSWQSRFIDRRYCRHWDCRRPLMASTSLHSRVVLYYKPTRRWVPVCIFRIRKENRRRRTSVTTETGPTRCPTYRTWLDGTPSPSNTEEMRSRTRRTASMPCPPGTPASVWSQVRLRPSHLQWPSDFSTWNCHNINDSVVIFLQCQSEVTDWVSQCYK